MLWVNTPSWRLSNLRVYGTYGSRFTMRLPLIDGKVTSFMDGDPAAAMRYTEAVLIKYLLYARRVRI